MQPVLQPIPTPICRQLMNREKGDEMLFCFKVKRIISVQEIGDQKRIVNRGGD